MHGEIVKRFLADHSGEDSAELIKANTIMYHLGETAFRVLVHMPKDPSDQVIVIPTGLGADLSVHPVVQAAAVREVVDPHATLVVLGNASLSEPVNNFTATEGKRLREGDLQPLRDRNNVVLGDIQQELPDAKVAYSGASLGAALTGSVLAHDGELILPTNAATIIEPANIKNRNLFQLGRDFMASTGDMEEVFKANFPEGWLEASKSAEELPGGSRLRRYMAQVAAMGMALGETYNLAKALGHDQLPNDIRLAPKDVGIVHMWSEASKISPDAANRSIAEEMEKAEHPGYAAFPIEDERSMHGLTVPFALHGAALKDALKRSDRAKT